MPRLTRKAFEKYGFSAATLLTDWKTIVGPELAAATAPERLKWPRAVETYGEVESASQGRPGATLILRVDGARALDVQYKSRQIIERINAYFGYRAVAEIRILQAPVENRDCGARRAPPPASALPRQVLDHLAPVADVNLRAALERLAQNVRRPGAR